MTQEPKSNKNSMTRRAFLATASAVAGATALGMTPGAAAAGPELKKFASEDIRNKFGRELEDIPYSSSNGRLAVILYGENKHVKDAVGYAAKFFAEHSPENVVVRFLWAKDNNDSPNDSTVGIYANGLHYGDITVGVKRGAEEIGRAVVTHMNAAHNQLLKQHLASLEPRR